MINQRLFAGVTAIASYFIYDYATKPYSKDLSKEEEKYLLENICKELPEIVEEYKECIVGGSTALKLYLKDSFEFESDDLDIILESKNSTKRSEIKYEILDTILEKDEKYLKKIYEDYEFIFYINKNSEKNMFGKSNEYLNHNFNGEFDLLLYYDVFGCINIPKINYQFIFLNKFGWNFVVCKYLKDMYCEISDLPVFIYYDKDEMKFKYYIKDPINAFLASFGYLREIKFNDKERALKYKKKGFTLL